MLKALSLTAVLVVTSLPVYGQEIELTPNNRYVVGTPQLAPDGTYVGGGMPQLAPDGTYVAGAPQLAPDGSYVGGGMPQLAPDGTYVVGTPELAPDGTYVGVPTRSGR